MNPVEDPTEHFNDILSKCTHIARVKDPFVTSGTRSHAHPGVLADSVRTQPKDGASTLAVPCQRSITPTNMLST